MDAKDLGKKCLEQWEVLAAEEKAPFEARAAELKVGGRMPPAPFT